ncbi:MAG: flavin reductase family protein [Desulfuromonadaceae bacterium]
MKKSLGSKTLAQPTPVWVVGTYDAEGKANIMAAAWGSIVCSTPACVGVSLRKATHTYAAIIARCGFTVNIPSEDYVRETDYVGIASGRDVDKFAVTGLTAVRSDLVDAPYVAEFPLILECRLLHTIEIGLHTQFIGEIVDVKADPAVLNEQDQPDAAKVKSFVYSPGARGYYAVGRLLGHGHAIGKDLLKDSALSVSGTE